jgi:hypothetical protein
LGGNSSSSDTIFTLQKKIVIIMAAAQPRASSRRLFKQRFYLFHASIRFLLSIIRTFFKQIHLYTILIQRISINFIEQMPTYPVSKNRDLLQKVHQDGARRRKLSAPMKRYVWKGLTRNSCSVPVTCI